MGTPDWLLNNLNLSHGLWSSPNPVSAVEPVHESCMTWATWLLGCYAIFTWFTRSIAARAVGSTSTGLFSHRPACAPLYFETIYLFGDLSTPECPADWG